MNITNDQIFKMIVDILDIKQEPENINELTKWIQNVGIDAVFKKVIQIYSNDLIY